MNTDQISKLEQMWDEYLQQVPDTVEYNHYAPSSKVKILDQNDTNPASHLTLQELYQKYAYMALDSKIEFDPAIYRNHTGYIVYTQDWFGWTKLISIEKVKLECFIEDLPINASTDLEIIYNTMMPLDYTHGIMLVGKDTTIPLYDPNDINPGYHGETRHVHIDVKAHAIYNADRSKWKFRSRMNDDGFCNIGNGADIVNYLVDENNLKHHLNMRWDGVMHQSHDSHEYDMYKVRTQSRRINLNGLLLYDNYV